MSSRRDLGFSKDTVRSIFDMISDDLSTISGKESNIPPMLQLLASLRLFTTGSFKIIAGDLLHISQSSVSSIMGKVANFHRGSLPTIHPFPYA